MRTLQHLLSPPDPFYLRPDEQQRVEEEITRRLRYSNVTPGGTQYWVCALGMLPFHVMNTGYTGYALQQLQKTYTHQGWNVSVVGGFLVFN